MKRLTTLLLAFVFSLSVDARVQTYQGGITQGDYTQKEISLIFSGDYHTEGALYILRVLREKNVKASFFLTGRYLRKAKHATIIRQILQDGHYLGPHSDQHLVCCDWSSRKNSIITREEFLYDLRQNYYSLEDWGVRFENARYFLPPSEHYSIESAGWADGFRFPGSSRVGVKTITMTHGTWTNADYTVPSSPSYKSSRQIWNKIWSHEKESYFGLNGHIMLIHMGAENERPEKFYFYLGALIDKLRQSRDRKGPYRLVTIPELLD